MKKIERYVCEICYTEYNDKEQCKECEKVHYMGTEIKDSRYNPHYKYPYKIEVKFTDGTTHWYNNIGQI